MAKKTANPKVKAIEQKTTKRYVSYRVVSSDDVFVGSVYVEKGTKADSLTIEFVGKEDKRWETEAKKAGLVE